MSAVKKKVFVKIPRQFFQMIKAPEITGYAKCLAETDDRFKGVDPAKVFVTYSVLARHKNYFDECLIDLWGIYQYIYGAYDSKTMNYVRKILEMLKFLGLVDYDFSITNIKKLDTMLITVNDAYEDSAIYMELYREEYAILEMAGYRAFTVYCAIKNYYLERDGCTNIGLDKLADVCRLGKKTIKTEIDTLVEMGVYEKEKIGMAEYQYNATMKKAIKTCNRYIPKPDRIDELWAAHNMQLKQKYKIESEEGKR